MLGPGEVVGIVRPSSVFLGKIPDEQVELLVWAGSNAKFIRDGQVPLGLHGTALAGPKAWFASPCRFEADNEAITREAQQTGLQGLGLTKLKPKSGPQARALVAFIFSQYCPEKCSMRFETGLKMGTANIRRVSKTDIS
ncbi:hypothetical protein K438DRAFT_1774459 [Mycena galopus ATCC 62051]|nr:hypothetical protein K438DRAFT_1774459 [Mycena galopus ATCC 62051]